jgi:ribonuclease P protein component
VSSVVVEPKDGIGWLRKLRANKFSWANRLHHPSDFKKFFHEPKVFRLGWVTVFRVPNTEGWFRLGLTFKTRASGVSRSRVKRLIREAFRMEAPRLGSYDYNVVIHRIPDAGTWVLAAQDLRGKIQKW